MKKKTLFLIVGMLMLSSMSSFALSENSNEFEEKNITSSVSLSQLTIKVTGQYVSVNMMETNGYLMKPGTPQLPYYMKTYYFPFGTRITDVNCEPKSIEKVNLDQKIEPSPRPQLSNGQFPQYTEPLMYENSEYPATWFDYDLGCGIQNGEQCLILKVRCFPIQYDPSQDEISVAHDFFIEIETEEDKQLMSTQTTSEESYQFIVITPSEFFGDLQPFIDHKNDREISTRMISLTEIYNSVHFPNPGRDEAEKIKYFIKDAMEQWNTQFVMLVGGVETFPTRATHIMVDYDPSDPDEEVFISDLYYADIYNETFEFCSWDSNNNEVYGEYDWGSNNLFDEVDLYPDVYLGRLAVEDSEELTGVLNKIIHYESIESYKQDWFSEITVIGGDDAPNEESNINEGEFKNQYILDLLPGFAPDKIWDSNYRLSWFNPSGIDNIVSAFEEGRGFVDWAGHGAPTVWTTYPHNGTRQSLPTPTGAFRSANALNLENEGRYPIVVVEACSTGKFNVPDCLAWSFVKNPDGGGIGSFSTTGLSWFSYGSPEANLEYLAGRMHVSLYHAYADGAETFGQMWVDGVTRYIQPNMDGGEHKTGEQWEPFGDPTLQIAAPSTPPEKPETPTGPSRGKIGEEQTFSSVATDPDGDDIYYRWDWGNDDVGQWIGPYASGEECEITHSWEERGSYLVRVQAKDKNGKIGEWSDPLELAMPKVKGIEWVFLEVLKHQFPLLSQFFK